MGPVCLASSGWSSKEFQIDGVWDGRSHDAVLRQFRAGIGAGRSTAAESAFAALGALAPVLTEVIIDQVQAIRDTVETNSEAWTVTLDLAAKEVTFLNAASGEIRELPVKPEGGEQSAGAFTLELMGIPAVETAQGRVTIDSVMALLYLQQAHAGRRPFAAVNSQDLAVTIEVVFGLLDDKAVKLKAQASAAGRRATRATSQLAKANEQRLSYGLPTAADLDAQAAVHAKAADEASAQVRRFNSELEQHRAVLACRETEAERARTGMICRSPSAERTASMSRATVSVFRYPNRAPPPRAQAVPSRRLLRTRLAAAVRSAGNLLTDKSIGNGQLSGGLRPVPCGCTATMSNRSRRRAGNQCSRACRSSR
ncbi:hypothetical protein E6W39_00955 [Kitasatospora acidiphila]|uniref:Uncharacterized protein n=1 Tax=Kitasatospora acidiphila TaxID=2567942 RepID=A0A540WG60_9ACTN|nr:hypothetical protein [Kitasatospora acidiphila]TQF07938.1 hypothetical protein E6W39_00955 [Kitasatospora acidiphila]